MSVDGARVPANFIDHGITDGVEVGGEHLACVLIGELIGEQRFSHIQPTAQMQSGIGIDDGRHARGEILHTELLLQRREDFICEPIFQAVAARVIIEIGNDGVGGVIGILHFDGDIIFQTVEGVLAQEVIE